MIRPAGPTDLPAVLEVFLACALADVEYLPTYGRTIEDLHRWFTKKQPNALWVAEGRGDVVGVVGATRRTPALDPSLPGHGVELCRLAVVPEFRRRGLAAELTEVVGRFAADAGSERVWLRCVDDSDAQRYYLRRGWQPLGFEEFDETDNDQRAAILGTETSHLSERRVT